MEGDWCFFLVFCFALFLFVCFFFFIFIFIFSCNWLNGAAFLFTFGDKCAEISSDYIGWWALHVKVKMMMWIWYADWLIGWMENEWYSLRMVIRNLSVIKMLYSSLLQLHVMIYMWFQASITVEKHNGNLKAYDKFRLLLKAPSRPNFAKSYCHHLPNKFWINQRTGQPWEYPDEGLNVLKKLSNEWFRWTLLS